MARQLYRGLSECKLDCSGHDAGYRYALFGGNQFSLWSDSFNNGMKIAQGTFIPPPVPMATRRSRRTRSTR